MSITELVLGVEEGDNSIARFFQPYASSVEDAEKRGLPSLAIQFGGASLYVTDTVNSDLGGKYELFTSAEWTEFMRSLNEGNPRLPHRPPRVEKRSKTNVIDFPGSRVA